MTRLLIYFQFFLLSCLLAVPSFGQELTLSPYSRYGVGDVLNNSTTRNAAMGGISVATDNYFEINRLNPASYADAVFTIFDLSGFGQISELESEGKTEQQNTAGFQNIAFVFPTRINMGLSFGFSPYSVVGYDVRDVREGIIIADSTFTEITEYQGEGGINQVYLGAALKLFRNRLRVGANLNYFFGKTNYDRQASVAEGLGNQTIQFSEEVFINGFGANFGVMYLDSVSGKQQTYFRIGATMDIGSTLNGERLEQIITPDIVTAFQNNDTIADEDGDITLPLKFGVGAMLHKNGSWSIGADFTYQDWANFSYFDQDRSLGADWRASIGGEWIPNIESPKYYNQIAFRAGGYFRQSYIQFQEEAVNDIGVTFGFALPASRNSLSRFNRGSASSRVNLAFTLGRRGSSDLPLQENYFRIRLGLNLNDVWFIKRVVD